MSDDINLARRGFLASGLLAASAGRQLWALAGSGPVAPLLELNYGQVKFAAGPVARQADENHRLLLGLDEDALLRPFRVRAGQRAPGQDLGGWYDTYAFAPGATFGQWMSALSRHYAITENGPTLDKVHRLVRAYAATVDAEGKFFQSNRFPAYTYDKLVGGLIDAQRLCHDDAALVTLAHTTQAAVPYLPPRAVPRNEHAQPGEDFSHHAWDESYTLPENQFQAWRSTGERRHLDLARRFLYEEFFVALARAQNVLPGKHAYSHVNALSSAAQAYLSLGNPMHLAATRHGFDMIAAQSFATGGWGPDEHFVVPGSGALGESLAGVHKSFETPCGAYAHFKLTRYLLRITRESRYGDSMERVLYNTVLGATPIQPDGSAFYYSDYTRRAKKSFHPDHWPCCSGTLPMIAADYAISSCFADPAGIYVNLYVPAQVTWRQNHALCRLRIQTDYPYEEGVTLALEVPGAQTFTVNLRVPEWAHGASLQINGKREPQALAPGRFAAVRRAWRSGDRIELQLPLLRRLESVDAAHPATVALLTGPLVLMRILENGELPTTAVTRADLLAVQPAAGMSHTWQVGADAERYRLKPFMDIKEESYSAYQDVLTS